MVLSLSVGMRFASTAIKSMNGGRQNKIESIGIMSLYNLLYRLVADNGTSLLTMRKTSP